MSIVRRARLFCLTTAVLVAAGCGPDSAPPEPAATLPTQAVTQLVADLRHNDLAAYARHAVPPALHARLETAWRDGRTTWPLTELPLDDRFPAFIGALAAQNAERDLVASYRRQFAGAEGELRSAAKTVGVFAIQYVRSEAAYSDTERDHHAQLIGAIAQWAQTAPLADSAKARAAIPQLVSAARATGLAAPDAFAHHGMDRSLRRLGPFVERLKQVLVGYGLDLDAGLNSVEATLAEQTGDTARVRIRYQLAGEPVDAYVLVERHDQRWYLSDVLRHAQAEADAPVKAAVQTIPKPTVARPAAKPVTAKSAVSAAAPVKPEPAPADSATADPAKPDPSPPRLSIPDLLKPGATQPDAAPSSIGPPGPANPDPAKPGAVKPPKADPAKAAPAQLPTPSASAASPPKPR